MWRTCLQPRGETTTEAVVIAVVKKESPNAESEFVIPSIILGLHGMRAGVQTAQGTVGDETIIAIIIKTQRWRPKRQVRSPA